MILDLTVCLMELDIRFHQEEPMEQQFDACMDAEELLLEEGYIVQVACTAQIVDLTAEDARWLY